MTHAAFGLQAARAQPFTRGRARQATAYKIGELRMLELRTRAEKALGPAFDVRDFRAVLLEDGALPMDILAEQVDAYIAAKQW